MSLLEIEHITMSVAWDDAVVPEDLSARLYFKPATGTGTVSAQATISGDGIASTRAKATSWLDSFAGLAPMGEWRLVLSKTGGTSLDELFTEGIIDGIDLHISFKGERACGNEPFTDEQIPGPDDVNPNTVFAEADTQWFDYTRDSVWAAAGLDGEIETLSDLSGAELHGTSDEDAEATKVAGGWEFDGASRYSADGSASWFGAWEITQWFRFSNWSSTGSTSSCISSATQEGVLNHIFSLTQRNDTDMLVTRKYTGSADSVAFTKVSSGSIVLTISGTVVNVWINTGGGWTQALVDETLTDAACDPSNFTIGAQHRSAVEHPFFGTLKALGTANVVATPEQITELQAYLDSIS